MCYFQSSPKNPTSVKSKTPSQRIKSSDFRAWDQFDADTAADHVDRQAEREEEEERKVRCNGVAGKTSVPVELSESGKNKILYFHTRNIHTYYNVRNTFLASKRMRQIIQSRFMNEGMCNSVLHLT